MGSFFHKANLVFKGAYTEDKVFIEKVFKNVHNELNLYKRPESYKTLLKDKYGNNSDSTKIRRKINNLIKQHMLLSIDVGLTRGKDKIFFSIEKDYYIVVCKNTCYYCDNTIPGKDLLLLKNAYELSGTDWIEKGNIELNYNEVSKCL